MAGNRRNKPEQSLEIAKVHDDTKRINDKREVMERLKWLIDGHISKLETAKFGKPDEREEILQGMEFAVYAPLKLKTDLGGWKQRDLTLDYVVNCGGFDMGTYQKRADVSDAEVQKLIKEKGVLDNMLEIYKYSEEAHRSWVARHLACKKQKLFQDSELSKIEEKIKETGDSMKAFNELLGKLGTLAVDRPVEDDDDGPLEAGGEKALQQIASKVMEAYDIIYDAKHSTKNN